MNIKLESVDRTSVHQVMTPTVIAVGPKDSLVRVVGEMVAFKIHRLFVVGEDGALIGVISAFDVLRKLRAETELSSELRSLCSRGTECRCMRPVNPAVCHCSDLN